MVRPRRDPLHRDRGHALSRLLLVVLAALSVSPCSALRLPPSEADLRRYHQQYAEAKEIVERIGRVEERLKTASLKNRPQILSSLRALRTACATECNKAIHMANELYEIDSGGGPAASVMNGPWKGRTVHWIAHWDVPKERYYFDAKSKARSPSIPMEAPSATNHAATYKDGVTVLFNDAFMHGPGWLAATIYHERIHYELFTTPGVGNRMTRNEREERAWVQEESAAEIFGLAGDPFAVPFIRKKVADYRWAVAKEMRTKEYAVEKHFDHQEGGLPSIRPTRRRSWPSSGGAALASELSSTPSPRHGGKSSSASPTSSSKASTAVQSPAKTSPRVLPRRPGTAVEPNCGVPHEAPRPAPRSTSRSRPLPERHAGSPGRASHRSGQRESAATAASTRSCTRPVSRTPVFARCTSPF